MCTAKALGLFVILTSKMSLTDFCLLSFLGIYITVESTNLSGKLCKDYQNQFTGLVSVTI